MRVLCSVLLIAFCIPSVSTADDDPYAEQRRIFAKLLPRAEVGDWRSVEARLDELDGYPLLPDLRAAWLRRNVGRSTDDEIDRFLEKYPDLAFSGGLRLKWIRSLAARRDWSRYLEVYRGHYAESDDTVLHCQALRARIAIGDDDDDELQADALGYWLSAFSQPKECDPVFAHLQKMGAITDQLRRKRIELALEAGQMQLARYLARPLTDADWRMIDRWERVRVDPARELRRRDRFNDQSAFDRRLVRYGFRRLARRDPVTADELLILYNDFSLDTTQRIEVGRSIALSAATGFRPEARRMLENQTEVDDDLVLAQWRVRLAIRDLDWPGTLEAIANLPEEEAERINWLYWRARALDGMAREEDALDLFEQIASERDYYGFLAADRIDQPYQMNHSSAPADEAMIDQLLARDDFIRAHELFRTGLFSRGRVEWARALRRLDEAQRAQASIVAHRWGWHSRAISTASGNGFDDDLTLRFPTPWKSSFERLSDGASLNTTWVYGIARSESLFMPDVSSSAGAVGLMQLMPATGAETAKKANIAYKGRHSLVQPETNITLGTRYLAEMMARFDNNQVMATAAYNAGPHRVQRWLPKGEALPADAWVESVPYRETRRYVRRVLAAQTVFDWRLGASDTRLSDRMPPVPTRIASRRSKQANETRTAGL